MQINTTGFAYFFTCLALVIHSDGFNFILNSEYLDKKPKNVPTGQMVLQYNLPHFRLINKMSPKIAILKINEVRVFFQYQLSALFTKSL
ncbi:hypothetical protein BuS5_02109 [Desulfosarcina sp. BuS5]|nr:hypothetical protein BuS5_02109 [Desulfosarcina sp. BuS5]